MQYYTAYGGLIGRGNLRKGEYVLITSATGVWGVASIHTAKMVGAIVIVTTVSSGKVKWLKSVGADHVIVTDTEDCSATVKEVTYAHGGVDVIFDAVAGEGMNTLGDIAAPGGRIVVYGALSRAPTPFPLYPALAKGLTLHGYTLFEYSGQPQSELYKQATGFILKGLESGELKPIVGHIYDFDQLVDALKYFDSGKFEGKVVVKTSAAEETPPQC
jgi:NADPH:quinone reductase